MNNPEIFVLDTANTRDLTPDAIGPDGRLRVLPAAYWAATTGEERALLGHRHAVYGFPTTELIARLHEIIDGRKAIEICSGSGVLADALGVVGTDSHQQNRSPWREIYETTGQPRITYGPDVAYHDAAAAIGRYKPSVVIGSWVTPKYDPRRHDIGGNVEGPDMPALLKRVDTYIHIGNSHVHRNDPMWALPHRLEKPGYVYSRARRGQDFIAVWDRT